MHFHSMDDAAWQQTNTPGSQKIELWRGGSNTYMVAFKIKAGTSFKAHAPTAWEQLTVVSGRWQVNDRILGPGDVAVTAPHEEHVERALEDTVIMVSVGNNDLVG